MCGGVREAQKSDGSQATHENTVGYGLWPAHAACSTPDRCSCLLVRPVGLVIQRRLTSRSSVDPWPCEYACFSTVVIGRFSWVHFIAGQSKPLNRLTFSFSEMVAQSTHSLRIK